ncbi:MAG: hypothetical protein A4E47_00066 [Methanosaeta sp. PtaU1.Bin028]|nr:MAG: hypothetical protein A4E47_00066 [Methanosaeta sp. PtaU1.Bin028]
MAFRPSTDIMKWNPEYSLELIVSFTCLCRFKFTPLIASNDAGWTSRTVPLASIVMQSITEASAMVRFERIPTAAGPSMPDPDRAMLASTRAASIADRFELAASAAVRSPHKGSPPVVCGPKDISSHDAGNMQVAPNRTKRVIEIPFPKLLASSFMIVTARRRCQMPDNIHHLVLCEALLSFRHVWLQKHVV